MVGSLAFGQLEGLPSLIAWLSCRWLVGLISTVGCLLMVLVDPSPNLT